MVSRPVGHLFWSRTSKNRDFGYGRNIFFTERFKTAEANKDNHVKEHSLLFILIPILITCDWNKCVNFVNKHKISLLSAQNVQFYRRNSKMLPLFMRFANLHIEFQLIQAVHHLKEESLSFLVVCGSTRYLQKICLLQFNIKMSYFQTRFIHRKIKNLE